MSKDIENRNNENSEMAKKTTKKRPVKDDWQPPQTLFPTIERAREEIPKDKGGRWNIYNIDIPKPTQGYLIATTTIDAKQRAFNIARGLCELMKKGSDSKAARLQTLQDQAAVLDRLVHDSTDDSAVGRNFVAKLTEEAARIRDEIRALTGSPPQDSPSEQVPTSDNPSDILPLPEEPSEQILQQEPEAPADAPVTDEAHPEQPGGLAPPPPPPPPQ